MKIKVKNGRYYVLYDTTGREIKLNNIQSITDDGMTYDVNLLTYYKDLNGKELGRYNDIFGKTFEHAGLSAILSKDFVKFLDKKNRE